MLITHLIQDFIAKSYETSIQFHPPFGKFRQLDALAEYYNENYYINFANFIEIFSFLSFIEMILLMG